MTSQDGGWRRSRGTRSAGSRDQSAAVSRDPRDGDVIERRSRDRNRSEARRDDYVSKVISQKM